MADNHADFTLTFRLLGEAAVDARRDADIRRLFDDPDAFDHWAKDWRLRLQREEGDSLARRASMHGVNPMYIPRNHRLEEVIAAGEQGDFGPFHEINEVLEKPYDDQPKFSRYAHPPLPEEEVRQTFCGT